ncbi:MAG: DUF2852 domain-containing protein [Pseudomonadota bacterium]
MTHKPGWFQRVEDTLDQWGKPAWIASMVAGFVLFWPIGLAILGYMIWSGRMGCGSKRRHWRKWGKAMERPTGNSAFDDYREETLRRLEDEQEAFTAFLKRLRDAKDRAEFDRFRAERDARPAPDTGGPDPVAT